jgi:hypothetical protein
VRITLIGNEFSKHSSGIPQIRACAVIVLHP